MRLGALLQYNEYTVSHQQQAPGCVHPDTHTHT